MVFAQYTNRGLLDGVDRPHFGEDFYATIRTTQ